MLAGRNVVLGVTGSIAAVKCVELAHELRRNGATVRAITTPAAASIIHPWSLQYATEHPVVTEITGSVEHVELCGHGGWADVLLIAPATANTIGKMAAAIDDTPVTTCATTALGSGCPIVISPAMHEPMWEHPGVLDGIEQLGDWGIEFVPPRLEEGKAKLPPAADLVVATARVVGDRPLDGRRVVVTSGATREPIDSVRILTNRSSGRMGRAIARACYVAGADVSVIHDGPELSWATVEHVETEAEMRDAVIRLTERADTLISAAAIGDFEIDPVPEKLDSGTSHQVELRPARKVLDAVREARPKLTIVGFKAESDQTDDELITAARELRDRIDAAFVVGNDASAMGAESSRAVLVDAADATWIEGEKSTLAREIVDRLVSTVHEGS